MMLWVPATYRFINGTVNENELSLVSLQWEEQLRWSCCHPKGPEQARELGREDFHEAQ